MVAAINERSSGVVLTSGLPQSRLDGDGALLGNMKLLSKPTARKTWPPPCAPRSTREAGGCGRHWQAQWPSFW
jgi:hypothetical protein